MTLAAASGPPSARSRSADRHLKADPCFVIVPADPFPALRATFPHEMEKGEEREERTWQAMSLPFSFFSLFGDIMNVLLLLKAVADSEAAIKPAADGKSVALDGISLILNPYDEYAVEEGLKLRDADGAGEVAAVSFGGDDVPKVLRTALAMGVDRAVHIKGQASFDALATAKVIAEVVKGMTYDLILCGKQAIDQDNAGVGVMVAELLDIPSISVVTKLDRADGKVICEREVEGGVEVVESPLPCLIACQKGLNEPRYASLKGIMAAKKKPLDEVAATAVDAQIEVMSIESRPPRKPGEIVGKGVEAVPVLIKKLREEAKVL